MPSELRKDLFEGIGFASQLHRADYEESSKPNSVNQLPRTSLFELDAIGHIEVEGVSNED
jgi:hypothetical protein